MRFMSFIKSDESMPWGPPSPALYEAMAQFAKEGYENGTLIEQGGLGASEQGAIVSLVDNTITVVDGPFTEAKEFVGGYWIIQARSKEEAVELASRAPLPDGAIEVRRIAEGSDHPPEIEAAARLSQEPPEQTFAE